ncbi:hypothetical protein BsWGS_11144 [Bradybaena similaris]
MGNALCAKKEDDIWKQQNKQMQENPAYKFVNLAKGGSLIDAYKTYGPMKVREIAENELSSFFYNKQGKRHHITQCEYLRFKWKCARRREGLDDSEKISDEQLKAQYVEDHFNKFTPHDACWDLEKRGGVGETPFHLLYLMDTPVHFEVARILLHLYPNLALDIYEGDEYYGESALHIAIVIGDYELVKLLVSAGALVNQRATGRFFLPEDQKQRHVGKTNYEGYAYYGEYPLAFAACLGNKDIYDYLLDHGANPDLQDSFGNTVLHMVVISDQSDMYKYAVRHHKHPASTVIKNKQNLTPLTLACQLGRHSIFKEMLDIESIEFWRFSTTMCSAHPLRTLDSIGPDGSTNWDSALMIIVNGDKDGHLEMLEGGVMRQLLIEKWKTFAQSWFLIRLMLATIHLALFSVSIYTRPMGVDLLGYRGPIDAVRYTSEILVCLSCLATIVYKIQEFYTRGGTTVLKNCAHSPAHTMYIMSCLLVLACIPFRYTGQYAAEDILLILAAPCGWFFFLFFARGYNLTGPFVTMIYKMITGDLLRFGIIYIIFLSGFTQGFYFLFQGVSTKTDDPDLAKFSNLPETILNLFQMTLGEFKYEVFSVSNFAPLTKIIFALFMILVPILLLNMLIAMMGNTYTQVISKSTKEWWKQWAKIVVLLEWGVSKKRLLKIQQAYSVKLAGAPPPADGSLPPPVERALVVIKTCSKSKAKRRRDAMFRWKTFCREIIRQLRLKNQGQPFKLEESLQKGELLASMDYVNLTSTVAQLAWEKDIDLTMGQLFVSDADNPAACSPVHPPVGVDLLQKYLPNGDQMANDRLQKNPTTYLGPESSDNKADLVTAGKRRLAYNRVSPLAFSKTVKDEAAFSGTYEGFMYNDSASATGNFEFRYPSPVSAERQTQTRSSDSHFKTVSLPASTPADTPVDCSSQRIVHGSPEIPYPMATGARSAAHEGNRHNVFNKNALQIGFTEDHNTSLSKNTSSICWAEDSFHSSDTRKRKKRKDKRKTKHKKKMEESTVLMESTSSVLTLVESAGSNKDSNV